jgi:plastocyanin
MRLPSALIALCLCATAARAGTITGQIDEPALRRKTQLVYLEQVPGKFPPGAEPAVMNQTHNTYSPHLLPVLVGTKVEFQSNDPELHNVFARLAKTTLFNNAVLPHKMFEKVFDKQGIVHLTCNVHREMAADILVLQNPFWAKPDATGHFTIDNVPPGKYTLRIFGDQLDETQRARTFQVTAGASVKLAEK